MLVSLYGQFNLLETPRKFIWSILRYSTTDISYTLDGASHTVGRRKLKPDRRRYGRSRGVDMEQDSLCILYFGNGKS